MSDNAYNYCCTQLQAALDDAPGGEKSWVPLRRSLVQACLNNLRAAGESVALMDELRSLLEQAQWKAHTVARLEVPIREETWGSLDRNGRIEAIRSAVQTGVCPDWLPDRRAWRRHYPEAFASNGGTHE